MLWLWTASAGSDRYNLDCIAQSVPRVATRSLNDPRRVHNQPAPGSSRMCFKELAKRYWCPPVRLDCGTEICAAWQRMERRRILKLCPVRRPDRPEAKKLRGLGSQSRPGPACHLGEAQCRSHDTWHRSERTMKCKPPLRTGMRANPDDSVFSALSPC